jgi:bis(5'-nucleosidyl)-tetraphosphatase
MGGPALPNLSCGAVIVHIGSDGTRFLLLRSFRHWDFPKGMIELGESPLEAALREVAEETELRDLRLEWGDAFSETGPYSRGKVARYYLARTGSRDVRLPVNPEIGRPEHSEYRWVDYAGALRLTTPRVRKVVRWAAARLGLEDVSEQAAI